MANPAWKVASEVADGYATLNPMFLKKYERHELDALIKELEKLQREVRSTVVPQENLDGIQAKNRKLLRLNQATVVIQSHKTKLGRS